MKKRSFRKQLSIEVGMLIFGWVAIFLAWLFIPEDSMTYRHYDGPMILMLFVVPVVLPIHIFQAFQRKKRNGE